MYQFTTTTVINSSLDSNGTTAKFAGSATGFNVTRVGSFKKDNIVSVYKRAYQAGVKEVANIQVPTTTSGRVIRLSVDVRLSQQVDSEYANTYLYFKKPVVVEVIASGVAGTDATALAAQLNSLKDRFGYSYITATVASTDHIVLTATNNNQRFWEVKILQEQASPYTNTIIQPEYDVIAGGLINGSTAVGPTGGQVSITTAGILGFGDDEYMIKSIMIPTIENTRYFGINSEERPILGGNYTQYTLRYSIDKDTDYNMGIIAPGKSITNHVFYVKSDLVSSFETQLGNVGLTTTLLHATQPSGNLDISNGDTFQIAVTGYVGHLTFSSATPTNISVSATGLLTPLLAGTSVITVTDSVGNTTSFTATAVA